MGLSGTEMLLKSIGINPAEIMASVESFKQVAIEMSDRQKRVEEKLDKILGMLTSPDASAVDDVLDHLSLNAPTQIGDGNIPSAQTTSEPRFENMNNTNCDLVDVREGASEALHPSSKQPSDSSS